jgi:peptidyl-prolyl cis-trans isomerase SurA
LLLLALPASAQRVSMDKVIAIVDDDVILQSDLDARIGDIVQQARANNQPIPPLNEVSEQIMETLIVESLQMQLAARASVRFDDDTLNRVMGQMAEQSNMTFDVYVNTLEEAGVYRRTREQVRRELTLREIQRGMVNNRISITDQEIDNFLNSEMGRTVMAANYLVDHLLVPISDADSNTVVEAKLQYASELMAAIEETKDLAQVRAMAQEQGRFPINGTNFGYRPLDQIPSLFSEIVPEMKIGDAAGPIRAGNGFHLIMMTDIQGGTDQVVKQTHFRHIMITPNEIRTIEQAQALATDLRERIIAGESFASLARQNSDDPSSVVAGGDLDWVNEGAMPPVMEAVVDSLEIGEISEPFQTADGWHIAEVLERRDQDLSAQFSKSQAETALRNRKFDLELENWLLELRESAFVELKD